MEALRPLRRMLSFVSSYRIYVPASLAVLIGVIGVWYGLSHDDIVTALGALLFLPSAALLFGVAARQVADRPRSQER